MNRISRILDGSDERAVYTYVGSSRRSQVALKNGASVVSTLKNTYDGLGRITSALYRNAADNATIVGFEHGYDKLGNPSYEVRTTRYRGQAPIIDMKNQEELVPVPHCCHCCPPLLLFVETSYGNGRPRRSVALVASQKLVEIQTWRDPLEA